MFIYLGDNDSVFEAALREDSSVRAYYESLPGMLREKVRAAGLYSAQEIDPPPEQREMLDALMMGGSPELLQKQRPPRPPEGFSPFEPGPKAAVRPTGLYENILRRVAPYGVRGVIWYQGEDDDARGWHAFYDESMKALIQSWRRLWKRELPFLQVELAPLHEGLGKALN